MSNKNKIVSIEIELKDYEPIKFSMDEAKELYEQLHSLFGEKQQHTHYHTYPWWQRPYYTWSNATGNTIVPCNNTTVTSGHVTNMTDTMTVRSSNTGMSVKYRTN